MAANGKSGVLAFSAACCALAAVNQFHTKLDTATLALALTATLPWALPLLSQYVSKLKVGGLFEADLRKEIEETKQIAEAAVNAAVAGVGKPPSPLPAAPQAMAHGVPMPRLNEDEGEATPVSAGDPNKGKFGGQAEAGGYKLEAEVKPMPGGDGEWFLIHAWVTAGEGTPVTFHLYPTFTPSAVEVRAKDGKAAIDRVAWGAFTLGATVGKAKLELDLAGLPSAPAKFRSR